MMRQIKISGVNEMKGQNRLHDEIAENILKKACKAWYATFKAYDEARQSVHDAYREVSDNMESVSAAKRLADASSAYYQAVREKEYCLENYEGTRNALLAKGWTEDDIDEVIWSVQI